MSISLYTLATDQKHNYAAFHHIGDTPELRSLSEQRRHITHSPHPALRIGEISAGKTVRSDHIDRESCGGRTLNPKLA